MKRIILLPLLGLLLGGGLFAIESKASDEDMRQAGRNEKTVQLIDSLIANADFRFVPTDVETRTGQRTTIQGYESAQFHPGRVYVDMTGTKFEGFYEGDTPYDRADQLDDHWFVSSTFDYHTGKITFDFVITRSTGYATLRVTNNRASQPIDYIGWIQPN